MITVLSTSIHSLFSVLNLKLRGSHDGSNWHAVMFMQPQGTNSIISMATRIHREINVRMAQPIPKFPILFAIVSSFVWRSVNLLSVIVFVVITPATVYGPTARTNPLPNPLVTKDLANIVPSTPEL